MCDGSPYLSLHFEVILEVCDDVVVLLNFYFVMILVELRGNILRRVRVLMGKNWISFIVHDSIFFNFPKVGLFLLKRKK